MKIQFIKELANIMDSKNLSLVEIKEENTSIHIERSVAPAAEVCTVTQQSVIENTSTTIEIIDKGIAVNSPMVGVFYAAPSPDSAPYVQKGSKVRRGDVLCIIEAMKLMNEICAEHDGIISEVCLKNGELVEFGQTLFYIKPGEENE